MRGCFLLSRFLLLHEKSIQKRYKCGVGRNLVINDKAMNILLWIVFGALVGWVASLIMRTNREQGPLLDIVVGIVGAVLGGWVANLLGFSGVEGFNLYSFAIALVGAILLIAIVKAVRGGSRDRVLNP